MARRLMYKGVKPDTESGWIPALVLCEKSKVKWQVFIMVADEWINIKVVADGEVKSKANYQIGYNDKHDKFSVAGTRQLILMAEYRPALFKEVAKNFAFIREWGNKHV